MPRSAGDAWRPVAGRRASALGGAIPEASGSPGWPSSRTVRCVIAPAYTFRLLQRRHAR